MKKHIMKGLICILALAAVLSFNYVSAKDFPLAPDFKLKDLSQNEYALSSNKDNRSVLLVFWTTWCPYCQVEIRELNKTYSNLAKDGIELLAIDAGESAGEVRNYVKRKGIGFKVLLDPDTAVAKSYGVLGVPTYVLIDKSSRIVFEDNYFPKNYKELTSK